MHTLRRLLTVIAVASAAFLILPAAEGMAANVELLKGTVRDGDSSHPAAGRAAVVRTDAGKRLLTVRNLSIRPAGAVRVYLVPRRVRGSRIGSDFKDLGRLKGNRGNQKYTIPGSVDLRRYNTVIFWCVPFTQTLGRADLRRS
jgi:hypothetical protein